MAVVAVAVPTPLILSHVGIYKVLADPGSQPALSDHGDEFDQSPVNVDVTEATDVYGGDVVSA